MRYLDALRTAILGLDQLIRKGIRIEPPSYTKGVCGISDAKPWPLGRELMDAIINVSIIVVHSRNQCYVSLMFLLSVCGF